MGAVTLDRHAYRTANHGNYCRGPGAAAFACRRWPVSGLTAGAAKLKEIHNHLFVRHVAVRQFIVAVVVDNLEDMLRVSVDGYGKYFSSRWNQTWGANLGKRVRENSSSGLGANPLQHLIPRKGDPVDGITRILHSCCLCPGWI